MGTSSAYCRLIARQVSFQTDRRPRLCLGLRPSWRGQDLNLRPSGYEPDELPDCSTPRCLLHDSGQRARPAAAPFGTGDGDTTTPLGTPSTKIVNCFHDRSAIRFDRVRDAPPTALTLPLLNVGRRRRFKEGTTPLRRKRDVVHERDELSTPSDSAHSTRFFNQCWDHEITCSDTSVHSREPC